ncbi:MAG: GNAT family N-acetyltransferase [Bacteroidales bacterium]|nr:GNAT family N-acetyltransferase [Candidatus Cryptobacteroides caccocaballi]
MTRMENTTIHIKPFNELTIDELYELLRVRSEVFVVEQDCVYQDLDGDDQTAIHVWSEVDGKTKALCRVCPAGTHMEQVSIGRVITTERGKGYGRQIMLAGIEVAKRHFNPLQIDIEAQEYAKGFYEGVGFRQSSDSFILDGIPHIRMTYIF